MPCNLQSATVGVVSDPRAGCVRSALCVIVLTDGSCAINGFEPCQAGDRAALRGMFDVPQGCLSRARAMVNAHSVMFGVRCMTVLCTLSFPFRKAKRKNLSHFCKQKCENITFPKAKHHFAEGKTSLYRRQNITARQHHFAEGKTSLYRR